MSQQPLPTILSWNYYLQSTPSTHLMLLMAITLRWCWQTPQQPLPTILSWNYYLQSTPSTHLMLLMAITMRWPQPQHKQQFTPIFSSLLWFSGPTLVTQHLQTNKTCKVLIILSSCKKSIVKLANKVWVRVLAVRTLYLFCDRYSSSTGGTGLGYGNAMVYFQFSFVYLWSWSYPVWLQLGYWIASNMYSIT